MPVIHISPTYPKAYPHQTGRCPQCGHGSRKSLHGPQTRYPQCCSKCRLDVVHPAPVFVQTALGNHGSQRKGGGLVPWSTGALVSLEKEEKSIIHEQEPQQPADPCWKFPRTLPSSMKTDSETPGQREPERQHKGDTENWGHKEESGIR